MDNSKVGTVGRVGLPAQAHDVVTGGGGREKEGEGKGEVEGRGGGRRRRKRRRTLSHLATLINKTEKTMEDQQINDQLNPTSTT